MNLPENILIRDFDYILPPEKIAQYPLADRDQSKLLIMKAGKILEDRFQNIDRHLPPGAMLVFNDTRVIRARLVFSKDTGATVEIFCLEPLSPADLELSFHQKGRVVWKCLIGNVRRWKTGPLQKSIAGTSGEILLSASKMEDLGEGCYSVEFSWDPENTSFSEILELAGLVPLPPYISRASEELDRERYQTIYAHTEGSVAAPTAGLHFTPVTMDRIRARGIISRYLTLHVGIATFRPVTSPDIGSHVMHQEKIYVPLGLIRDLLQNRDKKIFAVGTTTVRTMESLYWLGVKILMDRTGQHPVIRQWDPYEKKHQSEIQVEQALGALKDYLEIKGLQAYSGSTELLIVPGYRFRMTGGLITNFHMPQSTLLLLVAAFAGKGWKNAYEYALQHDFRFLSYGDACLFFPQNED